jgi:predicted secreted protein
MKTLLLIGVVLSFLAVGVRAGDYARLNFIGFSKSGKYLAFEEYGVQDGSGFPYSAFYVVNVETNSYAAGPFESMLESETATQLQVRTSARRKAAAALRKFGIVERNTGSLVISRLFTDLTVQRLDDPETKIKKIKFAEFVDSMYTEGDYDLTLDLVEQKTKACEIEELPVYKIALTLKDNKADTTTVLQKDATLPPSRGCPIGYDMQYVYLYKNNIVVFLNYLSTGFEGPDLRYIAVTGKYKPF